jgi:hypothetical protein
MTMRMLGALAVIWGSLLGRIYLDAGASAQLFRLSVSDMRGRPIALGQRVLLPTIHPAYLLRLANPAAKEAEARAFANDLRQAAALAHEGGQGKPVGPIEPQPLSWPGRQRAALAKSGGRP